jgi:hypothetical protein
MPRSSQSESRAASSPQAEYTISLREREETQQRIPETALPSAMKEKNAMPDVSFSANSSSKGYMFTSFTAAIFRFP